MSIISSQTNVVVVQQQPQVAISRVQYTGSSDYGTGALIFAMGVTFFILFFGCWWSLICSFIGIALAANVSSNSDIVRKQPPAVLTRLRVKTVHI